MARDFARWPKHEKLWNPRLAAYWEKYKGTPTKRQITCLNCAGTGWVKSVDLMKSRGSERLCGECGGVGKVDGERWIERFPTVEDFWQWWVSGKAYEGDTPDCQMWLW